MSLSKTTGSFQLHKKELISKMGNIAMSSQCCASGTCKRFEGSTETLEMVEEKVASGKKIISAEKFLNDLGPV